MNKKYYANCSFQIISVNALGKCKSMQSMVDDAGMGQKKSVNHSEGCIVALAAPFCTCSAGFEEQKVVRRSGYGSSAVGSYKRAF